MVYLVFIIALALVCIAAIEFVSLMTLDARNRQLKRRIAELERENQKLRENLRNAETLLEQQPEEDEEIWPELIDDDSMR